MPMCFIEAPQGLLSLEAKKRLHEQLNKALCSAFGMTDIRTYIREYLPENAAKHGLTTGESPRPVCILEVPELRRLDIRRRLVSEINSAMTEAYGEIANVDQEMIFIHEHAPRDIGALGRLQCDKPGASDRTWIPAPPP